MDPNTGEGPLGWTPDGAVAMVGDRVTWMGSSADAPDAQRVVSCPGALLLPGLVDCHTHAVWGGSRADEWLQRLAGADYTQILQAGGGILSTVRATRATDEASLASLCAARLRQLRSCGTTTVEVKSGYGLTPADEVKLLRAARAAAGVAGVRVLTTFLGAHAIPEDHRARRDEYVRQVVEVQLPLAAPHSDFADVYIDRGAFTLDEGERILLAARDVGLGLRVHAEQVDHTGAAALAARLGALSADHLERVDAAGIAALAQAETVAVMLPGAMLYLHDPPPPVAALREAGVPLAVATDLNPGSSPVWDLVGCATLACVTMGLTVEEALLGITARGGDALGRSDLGRVQVGGPADLVALRPAPGEPATPASLLQHLGGARVDAVVAGGILAQ